MQANSMCDIYRRLVSIRFPEVMSVVSSANIATELFLHTLGISLLYNKNKKGHKTDPRGTPIVIGTCWMLIPFTLTYSRLSCK